MRLSRTDFVPLMSIVAGGVIGASLSIGLLGRSPSGDVPVPYPVVEPSLTPVLAVRVQFSDGGPVITAASIEVNGVVVTPVVEPSVTPELRIRTEGSDGAVITSVSLAYNGMVITPVMRPQPTADPVVAPSATAEALRLDGQFNRIRGRARELLEQARREQDRRERLRSVRVR